MTLILLCSFVLVYLRRRYSKAATSSQPIFSASGDVGDHLHPIDPFPPSLPVIGMVLLTITSWIYSPLRLPDHFHSPKTRNEVQRRLSARTQLQRSSHTPVSDRPPLPQTRTDAGVAGGSRNERDESIEGLIHRLNRALANLPVQERGAPSSSSDAPPGYNEI